MHHSPPLGLKSRKPLYYPCTVIKICLPFTAVSKAELLGEANLESQGPSLLSLTSYMEPEVLHSLHSSLLRSLGLCSGSKCTTHTTAQNNLKTTDGGGAFWSRDAQSTLLYLGTSIFPLALQVSCLLLNKLTLTGPSLFQLLPQIFCSQMP